MVPLILGRTKQARNMNLWPTQNAKPPTAKIGSSGIDWTGSMGRPVNNGAATWATIAWPMAWVFVRQTW